MKLSKFLGLIGLTTILSLLYVWQQTEVVSLAYEGQKKLSRFQELLDENSNLRYNLKSTTSLVRLGTKVSGASDFQMPKSFCLVTIARPGEGIHRGRSSNDKKTALLSRILNMGKQAEARTISPSLTFKAE